jgi:RsiW-degrading membrane proteinase PrsW (M82 family)
MEERTEHMSRGFKQVISVVGLLVALMGLGLSPIYFCATVFLAAEGDADGIGAGIAALVPLVLTVGAGGAAFWHSSRALRGKPSSPMKHLPIWALVGIFGLAMAIGLGVRQDVATAALFFPPTLLVAAALPPLWAVSWFTRRQAKGLTWRRGLVALAGGATVSVFLALILEILFPAIVLVLVLDLAGTALSSVEAALSSLTGQDIAAAITSPGFIYLLVQIAVVAPLAEELAKPLVTLPLVRRLPRHEAFWVGAMAGAGFAALENVIYASLGLRFWAGILAVRALGGAIHPLGAGLMALSWRDILRGENGAWRNGVVRSAIAVGTHALWNGGSLLVITLAGAQFFGRLPEEIDLLGLSAAGTTLAVLVILGLAALWVGRATGDRLQSTAEQGETPAGASFTLSDRSMAIWALACLAAIVPVGITGLKLLLR